MSIKGWGSFKNGIRNRKDDRGFEGIKEKEGREK